MTRKPTADATEPLWTIRELAAYLNRRPSSGLYGWVHKSGVPYVRVGGRMRFIPDEVVSWVKGRVESG